MLRLASTDFLKDLERHAQARVERITESTPTIGVGALLDAGLVNAFREHQDALKWRDEIRKELHRRGELPGVD